MNMTQRGHKDKQVEPLKTYRGTSIITSQRVVVSEACRQKWELATLDGKKAFLEGVAYQELSE